MKSPLAQLRVDLGRLSQFQLSILLQTNQPTISKIESGLISLPKSIGPALAGLGLNAKKIALAQDKFIEEIREDPRQRIDRISTVSSLGG